MASTRRELTRAVAARGALGTLGVVGAGWLAGCAGQAATPQPSASESTGHVTVMFPGGASDAAPQALWVNVDLWKREGLAPLTWDSTWADLLKAATALTKRDSGSPKAMQLGLGRLEWLTWVWSAGGDLWSADGTKLLFDQQ